MSFALSALGGSLLSDVVPMSRSSQALGSGSRELGLTPSPQQPLPALPTLPTPGFRWGTALHELPVLEGNP